MYGICKKFMIGTIPKGNQYYPRNKGIKHLSVLDINPADEIMSSHYPILTYPPDRKVYASLPSEKYNNIISFYHQINAPEKNEIRVINPTGNAGIVFLCNRRKPDAYFVGILSHPREAEYAKSGGDYFVVLFWPGINYAFYPVPQIELADKTIPLKEILPEKSENLIEKIAFAETFQERISIFENFMAEYLHMLMEIPNQLLYIISAIYRDIYNIKNEKLMFYHYSDRHIRRLFENYIGIPPKLFNSIIRHQMTLKLLNINPFGDLTSIALEQRYYDQSHFIKEFKRFQACTPSSFLTEFIRTETNNPA
jgi:hypothetical protein